MIDISVHKITSIEVGTPHHDNNWVELVVKDSKGQKFELTMFLKDAGEDKTTIYDFLHQLRDGAERAIKDILSGDNS